MPITLAKIAANLATVTVTGGTLGEDSVTVEYYPGRVTEKLIAQLFAFGSLDKDTVSETEVLVMFKDFNETFCNLINSWDVYLDKEQTIMFPLDPDRVNELPFPFRMQIIYAIVADMRPEAIAPRTMSLSI